MDLITVTPLVQTASKECLSYFTDQKIKENSIVSVNIRNKEVPALVLKKESVEKVKSRIKSSNFGFKKINSVLTENIYSNSVLEAAKETSDFYSASIGGVLKAITPKILLTEPVKIKKEKENKHREIKPEKMVLQISRDERILFYKQHTRGVLAKEGSVFICAPTKKDVEFLSDNLKKGIEHATFTFHGDMSNKEIKETWEKALTKKPKLIISTGLFLSIFNNSFESLILERESSELYYTNKRPHFDISFLSYSLAKKSGVKFITSDTLLSVKTYKKYRDNQFTEATPLQKKYREGGKVSIIDMTKIEEKNNPYMPSLCSFSIKKLASNSLRSFIYTARRGLSPTTICSDCGFTFSCPKCYSPLVLHEGNKKRNFICHTCTYHEEPKDYCPKCDSWRLTQLGIGSEKVSKNIQKIFPKKNIIRMDSDNANTVKKQEKLWQEFKEKPNSILIGTNMAINYIRSDMVDIENIIVASTDSLLTYPNYSASERVFRTLTELSLIAKKELVIQTRLPEQNLLTYVKNKENISFFEKELETREKLSYPPFSIPITVTFSGKSYKIEEKENYLNKKFNFFNPYFIPSISEKRQGLITNKMLIKIPKNIWPNRKVTESLKSLSPEYKVAIDPPNII